MLVFKAQEFSVPGYAFFKFPGTGLLAYIGVDANINPWHQLGIVFAFVFAIRVLHYVLLWVQVYPYVKYQLDWLRVRASPTNWNRPQAQSMKV